jgi:hypothetical protein
MALRKMDKKDSWISMSVAVKRGICDLIIDCIISFEQQKWFS